MKRIQLFEFEDFNWLPKIARIGATNLIVVFHKMMGTAPVVCQLILDIKKKHKFQQIVDLGSGSGGAMPDIFKEISKTDNDLNLLLSDLHPNPHFIDQINSQDNAIEYKKESVNASDIGSTPKGLKTMIASFHHMDNDVARKILKSAQESKEPILIYEVAKNNIPLIAWWLFLPISLTILLIMSFLMTFFVRPLTLSQVVFTYLIPIIPIVYAWDGQASLVRTYTFDDIKELLEGSESEDYEWVIEDALKTNGKKLGYYIMGIPK